ncbi:MAG: GlmU family protein [Chitinophagaceae bacterium]|nr:GlmU family protein [Chitinophagaceae bacterium]
MNLILFDDHRQLDLLPFTYTRPVSEIRCGILTMKEKWEYVLNTKASWLAAQHLQQKFPVQASDDNLLINSGVFPNSALIDAVQSLKTNESLYIGACCIAARVDGTTIQQLEPWKTNHTSIFSGEVNQILHLWDIFSLNDMALRYDYSLLTKGRTSQKISSTNQILGNDIFIEDGATVECSILNASTGPIYIGKDALVMEGCMVRGPFSLGEQGVLKMGAKIYGATTLGPGCKAGGEVQNSVMFANSNKAHDGYLGNSVLGEWCNLGADTNNSNLKNNYEEVRLWNETKKTFEKTGLQFCGLMMGDHSKCGINTMFNTGTVVGVSCNIYGAGFPRNFIPSFSWGSANGFIEYQLNKAMDTASRVYARRHLDFNQIERNLFEHIFESTKDQRHS